MSTGGQKALWENAISRSATCNIGENNRATWSFMLASNTWNRKSGSQSTNICDWSKQKGSFEHPPTLTWQEVGVSAWSTVRGGALLYLSALRTAKTYIRKTTWPGVEISAVQCSAYIVNRLVPEVLATLVHIFIIVISIIARWFWEERQI